MPRFSAIIGGMRSHDESADEADAHGIWAVAGGEWRAIERVVCLGLDISGSITISEFYANNPERKKRWMSMGIAEQSATSAAAGLAKEGKLPVFGTYATFAAARNLDQIRTSVCYGNFNVLIAGAHGGVSVGSGWRDAPGAGRSVCGVRSAEYVSCSAVRLVETRKRPTTYC